MVLNVLKIEITRIAGQTPAQFGGRIYSVPATPNPTVQVEATVTLWRPNGLCMKGNGDGAAVPCRGECTEEGRGRTGSRRFADSDGWYPFELNAIELDRHVKHQLYASWPGMSDGEGWGRRSGWFLRRRRSGGRTA